MKKQVGIWIRVSTEDLAQGESPYYKPDQQTQGFRKCGQLRRSFFLAKCVCLSPKGESAFYMKRQDSNSIFVFGLR